ncbi:hypothetical protein BH10BAC5_BH10BAC5_20120 [soil metagenome]
MRKSLVSLVAGFAMMLLVSFSVNAQSSSANYTFSTTTVGSLALDLNSNTVDMSTGTTQLVAADVDDGASTITSLAFDFYLMGNRYTQFSASSNGILSLSSTSSVISGSTYTVSTGTTTTPNISAFAGDLRTGSSGKVHYKIVGSAPNRTLVVEFLNMSLLYVVSPGSNDGTYQVRLYETTGVIEFVYGAMSRNAGSSALNSGLVGIGFATNTTTNNLLYVTSSTNASSVTAAFGQNTYTAGSGAITNLNSASNGSRRTYVMTPPTPTAPTAINFTTVGQASMTVNWTDAANEQLYALYKSTDGGTSYAFASTFARNVVTSGLQSGLLPSTTYFWRVYSISEGGFSGALQGSQATTGSVSRTASTGGWNTAGIWFPSGVPSLYDDVTIPDGVTVTIDAASLNCNNLTIGGGTSGILQFEQTTARTFTVGGNTTINAGGTFRSNLAGTVTTHVLSTAGNITNSGTLNFSTNSNTAGANITFTGSADQTVSGTGATTNLFSTITMSKTALANLVDFNLSNFTFKGISSAVPTFLASNSGTGTIKFSGSNTFSSVVWSSVSYTIPATLGFWLNNANFTVTALGGSPTMSGLLRISAGTYNVGTVTGNSMGGASTSSFIFEGGTTNFASRLNVGSSGASFNMSAGVINISTLAAGNASSSTPSFGFTSATSVFTMSGGTINLVNACTGATPWDWQVATTSPSISGGTLNIGTTATSTNFNFRLQSAMPNVVVDNTTNNKTATLVAAASAYGTTTINSGATLNCNGFTYQERAATFTNNGTLTGTTSSSRLSFFSATNAAQTFAGSGVVTAPLDGISVQTTGGLTITHTNAFQTLRVNLFAGTITNSNKITLGTGAALAVTVQIGAAGSTQVGGSFDVAPTFNLGTGNYGVLYLQETAARTTSVEIPGTRTLTSTTIGNPNNVTIAGGALSIGTVTLQGGNLITTSSNLLTVTGTTTSSIARSTYTSVAGATSSGTTVTVTTTTNLAVGMNVTVSAGVGTFAANTTVTSITNSTTFVVSGTPTTPLSGGASVVSGIGGWVNGPLQITLAASLTGLTSYTLPLGKAQFNGLDIVNVSTGATTPIIKGEVFDANAGGSSGTNMGALNSNRYWAATVTSGNYTSSQIKAYDASIASNTGIASSSTLAGTYNIAGGNTPTVVVGVSVQSQTPVITSLPGFFCLGVIYLGPPLSGDYTVSATMFNSITGLNVEFMPVTSRVMREFTVISNEAEKNTIQGSEKSEKPAVTTTEMREVEETNYIPMVNGKEYKGNMYHEFTKQEKIEHNYPEMMSGVYITITAAISDATTRGLGGATRFVLTDALYNTEPSYPITIGSITGASATNTLTLVPQTAVTVAVTGSSASGVFVLNGADYITIDGSNAGTSSRDLTITNTNAGTSSAVVWMQTTAGSDAATNNTVKNCILTGNSNVTTLFGVGIGSATISTTSRGTSNNSNTISNNNISKTQYGIYTSGASAGTKSTGLTISNNLLNTVSPNNIAIGGIYCNFESGSTISGNTIAEMSGSSTTFGITLGLTPSNSYTTVTGQECVGVTISKNLISNIVRAGDGTAIGIGVADVATGSSAENVIVNNSITTVKTSSATPSDFPVGIYCGGGTGSTTKVLYNSVQMSAVSGVSTSTSPSYALAIGGSNPVITVMNNILYNNQIATTNGGTSSKRYAIALAYNTYTNLTSDYNIFRTPGLGSDPQLGIVNGLGPTVGTSQGNSIATWRTTTGKDAHSLQDSIPFTSATNNTILAASPYAWNVHGLGTQILSVTTDILGVARPTIVADGSPDLGAYNVIPSSTPPIATMTGTIASGNTTTFTSAGKTIATVLWNPGAISYPTQLDARFYPGTYPDSSALRTRSNCYWKFTATGGSGFNYDITLFYDVTQLSAITSENSINIAKSETGGDWYRWPNTIVNSINHTASLTGLPGFSFFTLTDSIGSNAPLPVELASFTSTIDHRNVELKWSTASEQNNTGFDVERKISGNNSTWSKVGNVAGHGTSSVTNSYSFKERNLPTANYKYRLKQIDNNGNFKYYDLSNEVIIGIPTAFGISQNYPNPFNPTTKINYDLPFDSKVSIVLFDMTGRQVAELVNTNQVAGYQTVQFNASNLSSGTYFYQINANGGNQSFSKTLKMMLIK